MPAVSPARLAREIESVASAFGDAVSLRRGVMQLLESYRSRVRPSSKSAKPSDALGSLDVPQPVLQSLGQRLLQEGRRDETAAFAAAEALWDSGQRETRMLAAWILGELKGADVAARVERWARASNDSLTVADLARLSFHAWRRADPAEFTSLVGQWLGGADRLRRNLALHALHAAVTDPSFQALQDVFHRMEGATSKVTRDMRRPLTHLLKALAQRSPMEATRYLLDEHRRGGRDAAEVVRGVLDAFPPRQRELLLAALSR